MTVYTNTDKTAALISIEFTPVSDGNFTFFTIDNPRTNKDEIRQWITSPAAGQEIVAETIVENHPVFITRGAKPKEELLKALEERGDKFELHVAKKPFNYWKWRGMMSMIGQPLTFVSGYCKKGGGDFSVMVFAGLNMAANVVNMVFGSQKGEDTHRLHQLKNEINDDLGEHMTTLDDLLKVDEKRAELRSGPPAPKTFGQKAYDFMQRNSVSLGEIGLRYLGGISLVAPMGRWKQGLQVVARDKSLWAGLKHIRNPDIKTFRAGMGWLTGKTLAFFAKTPDPYNPEPKSVIDNIRENYLFKASTLSEMMGASYLALDRFENPNRKIILGGKEYQDYVGGVGGLLFATAFAMRMSAPYGVKQVDMEEVYAHATDTLAKTPAEKLPQLMAETAATLKEHFKEKDLAFGEIFTKLMSDMYRYHHVALDNSTTKVDAQQTVAEMPAATQEPPEPPKFAPKIANENTPLVADRVAPADLPQTHLAQTHLERVQQRHNDKLVAPHLTV